MAALLGYHLQVLPEVCVGGAAVLKLLQVGLGTEQETGVKRERSTSGRSCRTHAEACGEGFLSDEVRQHPEDCSALSQRQRSMSLITPSP